MKFKVKERRSGQWSEIPESNYRNEIHRLVLHGERLFINNCYPFNDSEEKNATNYVRSNHFIS